MMLQLALAIGSYGPARRRSLELSALKTHALKIFDGMSGLISRDALVRGNPPNDVLSPDSPEFIFGGYSWIKKEFDLWKIKYSKTERRFIATEAPWARITCKTGGLKISLKAKSAEDIGLGRIALAGDQAGVAEKLLSKEMTKRHRDGEPITKWDMEPFKVLVRMLRDPARSHTIGGAPQLVKVYQYMAAASFPLYWPDKSTGSIFLQGRPCLGYEHLDTKTVDPDFPSWTKPAEVGSSNRTKLSK
jgi:hypothetical protein